MGTPILKIRDLDSNDLVDNPNIEYTNVVYGGPSIGTNTITLFPGWNLIGTFIDLDTLDSTSTGGGSKNVLDILSEIQPAVVDYADSDPDESYIIIAKDYLGASYLPEFAFNGIGDFPQYAGLQIRVVGSNNMVVTLTGNKLAYDSNSVPQDIVFNIPQGWSFISNPFDIEVGVQSFLSSVDVNLAKNNEGDAYYPLYDFDGIGFIGVGEAIQINTNSATTNFTVNITGFTGGVAPPDNVNTDEDEYDSSVTDTESNYVVTFITKVLQNFFATLNEPIAHTEIRKDVLIQFDVSSNRIMSPFFTLPQANPIYLFSLLEDFKSDIDNNTSNGELISLVSRKSTESQRLYDLANDCIEAFEGEKLRTNISYRLLVRNISNDLLASTNTIDTSKENALSMTIGYSSAYNVYIYLIDDYDKSEYLLATTPATITAAVNAIINVNNVSLGGGVTYGTNINTIVN